MATLNQMRIAQKCLIINGQSPLKRLPSILGIQWSMPRQQSYASDSTAERTALYDFHVQHGGKMVNFGGYSLPVQYADQGIAVSHQHTRKYVSIFDVSHMLQTYVRGQDAIECIESICTADIRNTVNGSGTLTVFTSTSGGILDDLIVNRCDDQLLYIVSNAAMKSQDMDIMGSAVNQYRSKGKDVSIEFYKPSDYSLIAVQGPGAGSALSALTTVKLGQLYFMNTVLTTVAGIENCRITRCGYTGEDGFEVSVPSESIRHVTEALLHHQTDDDDDDRVKLAGLGARDSLRLEAGLCLYGNDIDNKTTPIEGALAWLVAKRRREGLDFPGAQLIVQQLRSGVQRRRIGLKMSTVNKPPPARAGTEIHYNGTLVGHVTSGCPSPTLGYNIAMGYIKEELKQPGTKVEVKIRDRLYEAEIVKMPFVKTNYYMKPK